LPNNMVFGAEAREHLRVLNRKGMPVPELSRRTGISAAYVEVLLSDEAGDPRWISQRIHDSIMKLEFDPAAVVNVSAEPVRVWMEWLLKHYGSFSALAQHTQCSRSTLRNIMHGWGSKSASKKVSVEIARQIVSVPMPRQEELMEPVPNLTPEFWQVINANVGDHSGMTAAEPVRVFIETELAGWTTGEIARRSGVPEKSIRFLMMGIPSRQLGKPKKIKLRNALAIMAVAPTQPEDKSGLAEILWDESYDEDLRQLLTSGCLLQEAADRIGVSMGFAKSKAKVLGLKIAE